LELQGHYWKYFAKFHDIHWNGRDITGNTLLNSVIYTGIAGTLLEMLITLHLIGCAVSVSTPKQLQQTPQLNPKIKKLLIKL
jgi:hypothetical protein